MTDLIPPLSMGFPRQEYWSGLSFPSPGDLTDPRIEPTFPALASGFFTTEPPRKTVHILLCLKNLFCVLPLRRESGLGGDLLYILL